ncbi:hypothetical protein C943_00894 [Mariniradius saccharolyticus AK6]|uniref:Uncharacterized protein n=1 Tax=Mariniradius saccharolyticus AK6 TaxID=1239962 RepID=M7XWM7_9BACT|nr:hypothetical protein C943_00894 [Mariniradius saccharolyticus AK6]
MGKHIMATEKFSSFHKFEERFLIRGMKSTAIHQYGTKVEYSAFIRVHFKVKKANVRFHFLKIITKAGKKVPLENFFEFHVIQLLTSSSQSKSSMRFFS